MSFDTCCLTLSICAPNKIIQGRVCDGLSVGHCMNKNPLPCIDKSREVILVAGLLMNIVSWIRSPSPTCGGLGWMLLICLPGNKKALKLKSSYFD